MNLYLLVFITAILLFIDNSPIQIVGFVMLNTGIYLQYGVTTAALNSNYGLNAGLLLGIGSIVRAGLSMFALSDKN